MSDSTAAKVQSVEANGGDSPPDVTATTEEGENKPKGHGDEFSLNGSTSEGEHSDATAVDPASVHDKHQTGTFSHLQSCCMLTLDETCSVENVSALAPEAVHLI